MNMKSQSQSKLHAKTLAEKSIVFKIVVVEGFILVGASGHKRLQGCAEWSSGLCLVVPDRNLGLHADFLFHFSHIPGPIKYFRFRIQSSHVKQKLLGNDYN